MHALLAQALPPAPVPTAPAVETATGVNLTPEYGIVVLVSIVILVSLFRHAIGKGSGWNRNSVLYGTLLGVLTYTVLSMLPVPATKNYPTEGTAGGRVLAFTTSVINLIDVIPEQSWLGPEWYPWIVWGFLGVGAYAFFYTTHMLPWHKNSRPDSAAGRGKGQPQQAMR